MCQITKQMPNEHMYNTRFPQELVSTSYESILTLKTGYLIWAVIGHAQKPWEHQHHILEVLNVAWASIKISPKRARVSSKIRWGLPCWRSVLQLHIVNHQLHHRPSEQGPAAWSDAPTKPAPTLKSGLVGQKQGQRASICRVGVLAPWHSRSTAGNA